MTATTAPAPSPRGDATKARDLGPDFEVGRTCPECGRTVHPKDLFLYGFDPIVSADGEEHPELWQWYGGPEDSVVGFTSEHGSGILYAVPEDDEEMHALGWEAGAVFHRTRTGVNGLATGERTCTGRLGRVRL